jgi:hypothetical protein
MMPRLRGRIPSLIGPSMPRSVMPSRSQDWVDPPSNTVIQVGHIRDDSRMPRRHEHDDEHATTPFPACRGSLREKDQKRIFGLDAARLYGIRKKKRKHLCSIDESALEGPGSPSGAFVSPDDGLGLRLIGSA